MIGLPIGCIVTLLWLTDPSLCSKVSQSPAHLAQQVGESAQLQCSHRIAGYDRLLWYLQSGNGVFTFLGYMNLNFGYPEDQYKGKFSLQGDARNDATLTIQNLTTTDSATYFCAASSGNNREAYFGDGTKLTVLDPNIPVKRPKVKVLPPSIREGCVKKKTNRTLVCVATGFYPDHITVFWKVDGVNVTSGVRTDDTALRDKDNRFYSITSRLRVSYRKWFDTRSTFTCLTSFYDGSEYQEDKDSIKGVNGGGMDREYLLKSGLTAKLSYSVFIAKSFLYGLFISAVVWKIRSSVAKRYD